MTNQKLSNQPQPSENNQVDHLKSYWENIIKEDKEKFGEWWLTPQTEVLEFAEQFPNRAKMLDIGCGMGRHVICLAQKGFQVTGFDGSEEGVSFTIDWLKNEHLSARIELGDFLNYDYGESRFDGILSINVIHHAKKSEIKDVLSRIYRALKPSGLFLCTLPILRPIKQHEELIEPQTYIPQLGAEAGVPHFMFDKKDILELYLDFELECSDGVFPINDNHHYVVIGKKKN